MRPPGGSVARPAAGSVARRLAVALAAVFLLGIAGEQEGGHRDAVPTGRPPGFEPMDIAEDMERSRTRRTRELERQVDADTYYRRATPERRMRARYGGATWNLYDSWH